MLGEWWKTGVFYSPEEGGGNGEENGDNDKPKGKEENGEVLEWDAWHGEQSEEVQELISGREKGLKSALDTERDARGDLEKEVRALAKTAKKGSELETSLTEMADELSESSRKTDFYEEAHKAGVSNLKLAHQIAISDELFDKRGNANFGKLKEDYPELFTVKKKIQGDAGRGTGGRIGGKKKDMNVAIRTAADKR